ncbi:SAM-dependent methyltransferase [Nonomuraea sp. NPDC050556]|uniref:SAM-dependent methyltransferase n=1 Tax=Nonomuraea sp. NPDC050556 TaxID=3364369 RepID=UPI0037AD6C99
MTEERAPAGIDPTVPSAARIYDYWLGGKDNFESDRQAAEAILEMSRQVGYDVRQATWANRAFLGRVVRQLAAAGVRQFLDIGTGLPTRENVHQIVRASVPGGRVAYVDNDPIVLVHARALLADAEDTIVVEGDLREPRAILDHPRIRAHLDFDEPVAILVLAILHFFRDDDRVAAILGTLRDALPEGGYLAVSHAYTSYSEDEMVAESRRIYNRTAAGDLELRGPDRVAGLVTGLELLEPGVLPVELWRPGDDYAGDAEHSGYVGGVWRKVSSPGA